MDFIPVAQDEIANMRMTLESSAKQLNELREKIHCWKTTVMAYAFLAERGLIGEFDKFYLDNAQCFQEEEHWTSDNEGHDIFTKTVRYYPEEGTWNLKQE